MPINIHQLIVDTSTVFQPLAQLKGINLVFSVDDNLKPSLVGDPTRITQVMNNLVNNAIKFTDTGKVNLGVVITFQTDTLQTINFL